MTPPSLLHLVLSRMLALLLLALGGAALAQGDVDPPARVASLSRIEGSVVFAPAGETEWVDAVLNRPITFGDRLWTDRGARAELHLGSAVMHLNEQTFLDVTDLDDDVLQASLNEGTVNARVRELARGENFEIDTPQLAFRATRPGDYRIDVDPAQGTTRVLVRDGTALVYGANGQSQELQAGQVAAFTGRDLQRVAVQAHPQDDFFDRWVAERNRAEDQSMAARYIPRDVVGYQQLDPYGSWVQDVDYGAVWFPHVTVVDWAPYRYGHWEFIVPWGWTWIDDAPWGFAPFHYGRWAMIGSRWAWVPGRIGPRPVYAPALVVFLGGSGGVSFSLSIGSGLPGIGWFPLAPGEIWRPAYRASPVYVTNVNRSIVVNRTPSDHYVHQRRPVAITAVALDDFSRGRPVQRHWKPLRTTDLERVRVMPQPSLPEPRRITEPSRGVRTRTAPPPLATSPVSPQTRPLVQGPGPGREREEGRRPAPVPRVPETAPSAVQEPRGPAPRALPEARRDAAQQQREQQQREQVQRQQDEQRRQQQVQRDQERAQREQDRAQRDQEQRARRDQQVQQERAQREQAQRQQEEQRRQQQQQRDQERIQRDQQQQLQRQRDEQRRQQQEQERALRQQQAAQEHAARQQQAQEQAARQQAAQERAVRQQQAAQEQAARQQQQQQQRAARQAQPQGASPEAQPQPRQGEARGRGRDAREESRPDGGDEGRGRRGRAD